MPGGGGSGVSWTGNRKIGWNGERGKKKTSAESETAGKGGFVAFWLSFFPAGWSFQTKDAKTVTGGEIRGNGGNGSNFQET